MTQKQPEKQRTDADRPLDGKAPAPEDMHDHDPHPNDAVHADRQPGWRNRPDAYPATRDGLDNIDIPGKVSSKPDGHA